MERGGQWTKGKSCDTFCPMGPWMVTADEVGDAGKLQVSTNVNGERRQNSNSADLIFGIEEIVSYVSQFMTLYPGDVIPTGTPQGVAMGMKPPQFLKAGDRMRVAVEGARRAELAPRGLLRLSRPWRRPPRSSTPPRPASLSPPGGHPATAAPATFILLVVLSAFGAIIGTQLILQLGVTPNTSIIGALVAMLLARTPLSFRRSLGPHSEPGAERDLGGDVRRRQQPIVADRRAVPPRPARSNPADADRRGAVDAARRLHAVSDVRHAHLPGDRDVAAGHRGGRGDPRRRRRRQTWAWFWWRASRSASSAAG